MDNVSNLTSMGFNFFLGRFVTFEVCLSVCEKVLF